MGNCTRRRRSRPHRRRRERCKERTGCLPPRPGAPEPVEPGRSQNHADSTPDPDETIPRSNISGSWLRLCWTIIPLLFWNRSYHRFVHPICLLDGTKMRSATVFVNRRGMLCTFRTIFPRMGFTRSAICSMYLVLGAPLLLSLSPHWVHPTEGHRVFYKPGSRANAGSRAEEGPTVGPFAANPPLEALA